MITEAQLDEAVKRLWTADGERLARHMFDRRYRGTTIDAMAKLLALPNSCARNRLQALRRAGFQWTTRRRARGVVWYYLAGIGEPRRRETVTRRHDGKDTL